MTRQCTCPRCLVGAALQIVGATVVLLLAASILAEVLT